VEYLPNAPSDHLTDRIFLFSLVSLLLNTTASTVYNICKFNANELCEPYTIVYLQASDFTIWLLSLPETYIMPDLLETITFDILANM
jgi:hypothetical protein